VALLKALVFQKRGPELPALQAINSSLILDECAKDAAFISLVRDGIVKFRARHDRKTPRKLFEAMLDSNDHVHLGAWPELRIANSDSKERRKLALDYLSNKKITPTIAQSLSTSAIHRLDRAIALLDAIEISAKPTGGELACERCYPRPFKSEVEQSIARALNQKELKIAEPLRRLLDSLQSNADQHLKTRTDAYRAIDERTQDDTVTRRDARTLVSAAYSKLVAESLSEKPSFHSAYDSPIAMFAHKDGTTKEDVVIIPQGKLRDLTSLEFTWAEIEAAWKAAYGNHSERMPGLTGVALSSLAQKYAERNTYFGQLIGSGTRKLAAHEAGCLVLAGHWTLSGDLANALAAGTATAISLALGNPVDKAFKAIRVKHAQRVLRGFYDGCAS